MGIVLKEKGYAHFDLRKKSDEYYERVKNPKWVEHHSFYPFIHCPLDRSKFSSGKGVVKKTRDIYYSSHEDSFIYQYYGQKLNQKYDDYAKKMGINKAAIAYRDCTKGKCNIHFAKEVFDFLVRCGDAYVFVADLTGFFDQLDHKYLKERLSVVLETPFLSSDQYKVFRSITNFAYVDYNDVERVTGKKRAELKDFERLLSIEELHKYRKKEKIVHVNKEDYGIPQGSSVSAVYANIYMTVFDKKVNDYITSQKGLYRRYCDDIIIVVPLCLGDDAIKKGKNVLEYVMSVKDSIPRLDINLSKTNQYFKVDNNIFENGKGVNRRELSYLGFCFDGKCVRIRDKSVYKFYYRAYRKIEQVNNLYLANDFQGFTAGKKAIYNGFTHLFSRRHAKGKRNELGNFYTYVRRADEIMSQGGTIESGIRRQLRRHWGKIDGQLYDFPNKKTKCGK